MKNKLAVAALVTVLSTGFTGGGFHGGGPGSGHGGGHGHPGPQPTNSTVTINQPAAQPGTVIVGNAQAPDARQPYSDEHLFAYPNAFGGTSVLVKPNVKTLAPGVESRDGQLFIDGHSSGPCDNAQRAGLPKCFTIGG